MAVYFDTALFRRNFYYILIKIFMGTSAFLWIFPFDCQRETRIEFLVALTLEMDDINSLQFKLSFPVSKRYWIVPHMFSSRKVILVFLTAEAAEIFIDGS